MIIMIIVVAIIINIIKFDLQSSNVLDMLA